MKCGICPAKSYMTLTKFSKGPRNGLFHELWPPGTGCGLARLGPAGIGSSGDGMIEGTPTGTGGDALEVAVVGNVAVAGAA